MEPINATPQQLATADEFKKLVESLQPNQKCIFPDTARYLWLQFSYDHRENLYSWSMEKNYKVIRMTGYVHPLINSGNFVKSFKTLAGAKRNLILYMKCYFENLK
jgi:hypothetical protein